MITISTPHSYQQVIMITASNLSLTSPILGPIMHPIQHGRKWRNIIQQLLEMLDCLLLSEVQAKFAKYLFMNVTMLNMRDVSVHHQSDQVQNQVRALAKDSKRREAEVLEPSIVHRLDTSHGVYHLFAHLDRRS